MDSTTLNDSDKLISYDGCGCAGGQITTIEGENITETDWQGNNPNNLGRRKQKIYQDILGRTYKTEIYNWDGTTVYSSTVTKYNGRDQVEWVNRYEGAAPGFSGTTPPDTLSCPTGTCQKTSVTYDGHGRVKTQHRPEQDLGKNTVYNYNADDTIESVTDARGAITDYNYNYQRLVNLIEYTVPDDPNNPGNPDPNVSPTHDVSFSYDALGNRISMEDGLGTIDYEYTDLSQLKSETREFDDSLPDAPIPSTNGFKLEYTYTISGQLKSLKDPYGQQFNYTYDVAGRLQQVAGSAAFAGITTYANNPTYNARGSLIGLQYGNGVQMAVTGFNSKLQATGFEVKKNTDYYINKQYQFYSDGSLKFVDDGLDQRFDRLYKYDHLGRTVEAKAGIAARGGTSTDQHKLDQPYTMQYTHDAFGHITNKTGYYYSSYDNNTYSYDSMNRSGSWGYDAEGNVTYDSDATSYLKNSLIKFCAWHDAKN